MVSLGALWIPILLSAIIVFITSFLVHMVLKYHSSDYSKLPNEDVVRAAIRAGNPPPAQYVIPHCADMKQMDSPEMKAKYVEGPVGILNIKPSGAYSMGPALGQWFVFNLVVSFFVAYVAAHTIPSGTVYLEVFRVAGTVAFLAYGTGVVPAAIWMGKPWSVTFKELFDGLLYGLVTAGTFGWLWPR